MSQLLEAMDVMLFPWPGPLGCTIIPLYTPCTQICTSQARSCEHCSVLSADEKPFPQLKGEKIVKDGIGFISSKLLLVPVCSTASYWVL